MPSTPSCLAAISVGVGLGAGAGGQVEAAQTSGVEGIGQTMTLEVCLENDSLCFSHKSIKVICFPYTSVYSLLANAYKNPSIAIKDKYKQLILQNLLF